MLRQVFRVLADLVMQLFCIVNFLEELLGLVAVKARNVLSVVELVFSDCVADSMEIFGFDVG